MKDKRAQHEPTQTESIAEGSRSLDGAIWRDWRARGDKDPTFLAKLVAIFIDDTNQRLAAISKALADGGTIECAYAAHALATGCLQIGATCMAKLCLDIERAAQSGATELGSPLLQRIHDEYRLVRRELEAAVTRAETEH